MPINPINGPGGTPSSLPPDGGAAPKAINRSVDNAGVIDPGLLGDQMLFPGHDTSSPPTGGTLPALFRPEEEEPTISIPGHFFEGQVLTAVSGNERDRVTVVEDEGYFILYDTVGGFYDYHAFVYDDEGRRVGLALAGRLRAPSEYEVNSGQIIELRGGKPHRLLATIIPTLGNDGLITTSHLTGVITLENGQRYEVQNDGILKSLQPVPLDLKQDFFEDPARYYNATTGRLTFPARGADPTVTIDLGLVGFPSPSIKTSNDRLLIQWDSQHVIALGIKKRGSHSISINIRGTGVKGGTWQQGGGIQATAGDLATTINAYTQQQREPGLTRMAKEAATHPTPGITRYTNLGTDHEQPTPPRRIDSWTELEGLITAALRVTPAGQALEFEIEQRFVDALEPPADFLERVNTFVVALPTNPVTLVVHGHPIDPPRVIHFNYDGMTYSTTELDQATQGFWNNGNILEQMLLYINANFDDAFLLRAYFEIHEANPHAGQDEFLNAVIDRYNTEAAEEGKTLILDDRRTIIYPWLEKITNNLRDVAAATATVQQIIIPPGALYDDLITFARRAHPASDDPRRQVVFVDGGGAMGLALAAHIRRRMDNGELPLDVRIVGFDGYFSGMARLARDGTSTSFTNPINTEEVLPLQVQPNRLLIPTLRAHKPGTVFFTQKASNLSATKADPALATALAEISPAMPNPAKSFLPNVLIPYGAIRNGWLTTGKPNLAGREIVIGGYAKAEDILEGSEDIYLVIAGENAKAMAQMRDLLGDHNIEYIVGAEMAEVIQAAGAFKNITTYYSGRRIMARALAEEGYPSSYDLQAFINGEVAGNIELIEETIARVAPFQGMNTDAVSLPFGVIQDVIKCLDLNRNQLAEIRRRFESAVIAGNLKELDRLLDNLTDEKIKLGGATRNPRDGYVDELLFWAYHALHPSAAAMMEQLPQDILALARRVKGRRLPEATTFEEFYQAHYPERWKGQQRQEGRSGIGPLTEFEDDHKELTLPVTITMAAHAYARNTQRTSRPEYQVRELGDSDNPVWGLPAIVVNGFRNNVRLLNGTLLRRTSHGEKGTRQVIRVGLGRLTCILSPDIIHDGAYAEVNRRLIGIRDQMERLIEVLRVNHINEERAEIFIAAIERTLVEVQDIFRDEIENTTLLLGHLRHIAKGLHAAEQALLTGYVPYRYTSAQVEGSTAFPVSRPTNVSQKIPVSPSPMPLEQSAEHFLNVSIPSPVYTPRKTSARHPEHNAPNHHHSHSIHPDLHIPVTPFWPGESTTMDLSIENLIVEL